MKHQEYVDAIKKSAVATGKKVLVEYFKKQLPFMFLPGLGPITGFVLEKAVEVLVRETEFGIFFQYIDLRVDKQGLDFSQAAIKNYRAQQSGDKDEIAKAEKELIEKFRSFAILRN